MKGIEVCFQSIETLSPVKEIFIFCVLEEGRFMGGSYESTNHSEHAHQSKPWVLCDDIQAGTESDFWSYVRETLNSH